MFKAKQMTAKKMPAVLNKPTKTGMAKRKSAVVTKGKTKAGGC